MGCQNHSGLGGELYQWLRACTEAPLASFSGESSQGEHEVHDHECLKLGLMEISSLVFLECDPEIQVKRDPPGGWQEQH